MTRILGAALALWAWTLVRPALADAERFDVMEYRVEGNSVLGVLAIEAAVYPHLGEGKSIADVEAARARLERAYHDGGYLTVFVDIPEQEVTRGVVRLRVTEGQVERLRVSGARYYSLGRIKRQTPDLAEGGVPYFPDVQKQLAAVNRAADRRVTPVLRPGRTPGKVEVDLKVEDQLPLHGGIELNDRYSPNTTHTRLSASLRYDNLWQREHGLSLNLSTAPEATDESRVLSATYVWPRDNGHYLAAYGVISDSDVAALGDMNVVGQGSILGLRYILPLRGRPGLVHTLTLGADYKDFDETVGQQGADLTNTPISYLPFTLAYDATQSGEKSTTQFTSLLNFSVRGLADDEVECVPGIRVNEFACKRYLADPNYAFLRLDLRHTRRFDAGWSLFARAAAQFASGPLISNEQFTAGGADSVRGYPEAVVSGDDGLAAGLELRAPSLVAARPEGSGSGLGDLVLYAFVEGASLRVRDALPGQTDRFDLLAAGVGLRFGGWGGVTGGVDLAHPFEDAGEVEAGEGRLHFRLGYEF
ncbi:MAG: ShlB/FhaC/HecB family hemolysin secretion/activation protein [Thiobacillaceae bacterium]|nr:ShlB/FhaC/HecB family hemolysin secretion/activation protein [Thiobacillaceae bacterium]